MEEKTHMHGEERSCACHEAWMRCGGDGHRFCFNTNIARLPFSTYETNCTVS
jgi:hypothetical protein